MACTHTTSSSTTKCRPPGSPVPEPQTGKATLRLSGNQVEGRIIDPPVPVDHRIVLTLEGNRLTGTIEADMEMPDTPKLDLELGEDTLSGTLTVMGLTIDIEATRTSAFSDRPGCRPRQSGKLI